MTIALIDLDNLHIEFPTTKDTGEIHPLVFRAEKAEDLCQLSGPQMVALYNATAAQLNSGIDPVKRFATKEAAIKRLWANITDLAEVCRTEAEAAVRVEALTQATQARDGAAPAKATDYPAPAPAPAKVAVRRGTGINLAPQKTVYACRAGSKQARLVDLLSRPEGATMTELMEAMSGGSKPWLEVTVKSGLNWDMNKVKGYGIRTTKRGNDDCYHLVLPQGMTAPLAHTPRKGG